MINFGMGDEVEGGGLKGKLEQKVSSKRQMRFRENVLEYSIKPRTEILTFMAFMYGGGNVPAGKREAAETVKC